MSSNSLELNPLTAISPLDGRYWGKLNAVSNYFSEFSLFKYRVLSEIEYFISLCEIPLPQLKEFPKEQYAQMRSWYQNFSVEDAIKIKDLEKITNHDVKSVEYWVKMKFDEVRTLISVDQRRSNMISIVSLE